MNGGELTSNRQRGAHAVDVDFVRVRPSGRGRAGAGASRDLTILSQSKGNSAGRWIVSWPLYMGERWTFSRDDAMRLFCVEAM